MGRIGEGTSCLLVKDDSLYAGMEAPLYKWLRKEGFVWDGGHGCFGNVNWVYINISSMVFKQGMPGVGITRVICGHAITIDEFMQIYAIYQKYNGLEPLRMSAGEQAAWHEKMRIEKEKERKYWEMLTFEDYVCELKSLLRKVYTGIPADEVLRISCGKKALSRDISPIKDRLRSRKKSFGIGNDRMKSKSNVLADGGLQGRLCSKGSESVIQVVFEAVQIMLREVIRIDAASAAGGFKIPP